MNPASLWNRAGVLNTEDIHPLRWCFDDGNRECSVTHISKISHRSSIGLPCGVCEGCHHFYPRQTIQWALVPCTWGRSFPERDHTHQDRHVSGWRQSLIRALCWFAVTHRTKETGDAAVEELSLLSVWSRPALAFAITCTTVALQFSLPLKMLCRTKFPSLFTNFIPADLNSDVTFGVRISMHVDSGSSVVKMLV